MSSSGSGRGSANNPTVGTDDAVVMGVLPKTATEADYAEKLAREAEAVLPGLEDKLAKLREWVKDAERALSVAQKEADRARRAADKAKR